MASEVSFRHSSTGKTLYFTIRSTARTMWNTAGTPNFETLTVANWADYDTAMSESPASSYFYAGTFPAISGNMIAGWYLVDVYDRLAASPAISDTLLASMLGYWDGASFRWWGVDALAANGTVLTPRDLGASVLLSPGTGTGQVSLAAGAVTAGTVGDKSGYSLGTAPPTASAITTAVWDALLTAILTDGSVGKLLKDNLNASVGSRSTYAGADTAGTTTLLERILGTLAAGTHNAQTGDAFARLGAPAGASVSADVAAVKGETASILARLGAWTGTGINTILGAFRALCAKAAALTPTDLSGSTTYDNTTDSLEAIRDTAILAAGGDGSSLTAIPWNPAWDAEVQSEAADALAAYGTAREATVLGEMALNTGAVLSRAVRTAGSDLSVIRGDCKTITFALGTAWPLTGKTPYLTVKARATDANSAAIVNAACTVTDAANGVCTYTPIATTFATAGRYVYELVVENAAGDASPETAIQGTLLVKQDVRQ